MTTTKSLPDMLRQQIDLDLTMLRCDVCQSLERCEHTPEGDTVPDYARTLLALLAALDLAAAWDKAWSATVNPDWAQEFKGFETTLATVITIALTDE